MLTSPARSLLAQDGDRKGWVGGEERGAEHRNDAYLFSLPGKGLVYLWRGDGGSGMGPGGVGQVSITLTGEVSIHAFLCSLFAYNSHLSLRRL